jgi:hypothetical protein
VSEVKKALVLFLSAAVAASLAVLLSGCGLSSEDKALQYINRGDGYAYQMSGEAENLSAILEDFFATLQGPNPETIARPGGPIERYSSALRGVVSLSESAEAEYSGALTLSGVEAQAEYATMMIDVAKRTRELMGFIEEWFDEVLDVIMTLDEKKIRAHLTGEEFEDGLAQMDDMRSELEKAAGEAKSYRMERKF